MKNKTKQNKNKTKNKQNKNKNISFLFFRSLFYFSLQNYTLLHCYSIKCLYRGTKSCPLFILFISFSLFLNKFLKPAHPNFANSFPLENVGIRVDNTNMPLVCNNKIKRSRKEISLFLIFSFSFSNQNILSL